MYACIGSPGIRGIVDAGSSGSDDEEEVDPVAKVESTVSAVMSRARSGGVDLMVSVMTQSDSKT